jgi:hypothetical protein
MSPKVPRASSPSKEKIEEDLGRPQLVLHALLASLSWAK